jgi:hypothetical protein
MPHCKRKQSNKANSKSNKATTNTPQTGTRRACAASEISATQQPLPKRKKSTVTVDVDKSEDNSEEDDVCQDDSRCEEDDEEELGNVFITIQSCQLLT